MQEAPAEIKAEVKRQLQEFLYSKEYAKWVYDFWCNSALPYDSRWGKSIVDGYELNGNQPR